MQEYWVYENWTHRRARVHLAECGHCNHGRGAQASHSGRNDKWHGPFLDRTKAFDAAARLGQAETKGCASCAP
jgi:F-type H+-transporting ATPase subunit beta